MSGLDFRSNDGLEVDPAEALDAFRHPYALAATRGVHIACGDRGDSKPIHV